ncbi:hypothetical protein [Streptomyces sp. NPDC020141]|uniref:hypothetical protein n=1 Tax=Streptomyces sp. NPDC020141 TaxID=3365065 RepID=UPI0037BA1827
MTLEEMCQIFNTAESENREHAELVHHLRRTAYQAVQHVGQQRACAEGRSAVDSITRFDALRIAREHVEAMSTNSRGFQDGVKLDDKIRAVDTFARFLAGDDL